MRSVFLLLVLLCSAACSNEQIYNAVQENQKLECQKYPDTRYEECMKELSTPYREYEEERRADQ